MSTDITITLAIIGISALILHLKSHVKFIAVGSFVGLVLAETIGLPIAKYLIGKFDFFATIDATSVVQLSLLLLPAMILGINHTVDKRRLNLPQSLIYVAVTTLFLLSNMLAFLPEEWRETVIDRSFIALELKHFRIWLLVAAAALIIIDSFEHKRVGGAKKKAK